MQDRKKHVKKTASYFLIYSLVLAACVLAFFLTPFEKTESMWIAAGFTFGAVLISFACSVLIMRKANTARKAFYAVPVIRVAVIYMVVQILIGVVLCALDVVTGVSEWTVLIVCVIWFAAAMGGLIAAKATKEAIAPIESDTEVKIRATTEFRIDIVSVLEACQSDELRKDLEKLADDFKYSDPVSSVETVEIEKKIASELAELGKEVEANKVEKAKEGILTVRNLLSERNRICKAYKR